MKKGNHIFTCIECGKEFKAWKCQKRKYCSNKCSQLHNVKDKNHVIGKTGKNHPKWKDTTDYFQAHYWVKKIKPKPKGCEDCKVEQFLVLANLNGVYDRNPENYKWLCKSCHSKLDRMHKNFKEVYKKMIRDEHGKFVGVKK